MRRSIHKTYGGPVATALVVALLARVTSADVVLLHDHGEEGFHSHAVTLDDLHGSDLSVDWHSHHDDIPDDQHDNSEDGSRRSEHAEPLVIFVNAPAVATGVFGSFGSSLASMCHASFRAMPRSTRQSDRPSPSRFLPAPFHTAPPLRAAFALDALLQSSGALLL